jgi:hypothetical protein
MVFTHLPSPYLPYLAQSVNWRLIPKQSLLGNAFEISNFSVNCSSIVAEKSSSRSVNMVPHSIQWLIFAPPQFHCNLLRGMLFFFPIFIHTNHGMSGYPVVFHFIPIQWLVLNPIYIYTLLSLLLSLLLLFIIIYIYTWWLYSRGYYPHEICWSHWGHVCGGAAWCAGRDARGAPWAIDGAPLIGQWWEVGKLVITLW